LPGYAVLITFVDLGGWQDLVVAKGYRPVVRDQEFLLPPNMSEWLPGDHLVWFVIDTVAVLDTSVLHARAGKRRDGQRRRGSAGRAGYDPDLLLTVLLYGYACGERSSRRIERLCGTDVAFRIACAGDAPDHTVLARFRQAHAEAFAGLFAQVLRLCRQAGLVRLGTVAIDGTKIAANASGRANRGEVWLREQAEKMDIAAGERADRATAQRILAEAAEADAAEDAAFGDDRGDELPAPLRDRTGRRERIVRALAQIEQQKAAEQAEQQQQQARRADRVRAAEQALAVEKAAQQAKIDAWEQAWEHAVATRGALPRGRAPRPVEQASPVRRATVRLARAQARAQQGRPSPATAAQDHDPGAAAPKPPRANVTDPDSRVLPTHNGWVQGYNGQFAITADQIILTSMISTNPNDCLSFQPMMRAAQAAAADLGDPDGIGVLLCDTGYVSDTNLTLPGPDRLIALGKTHSVRAAARDNPATGDPPPDASPRQAMDHRLRTPDGAALYARRAATVEPGIGNIKKLLTRFCRRGLAAVTSETHLTATAFNLLKIWRAAPATA
jgi:transposase